MPDNFKKVKYVAGFLFYRKTNVALVTKKRPEWQKGKMNGVGGHIEEGETPLQAMCREFKEETGANFDDWDNFCTIEGDNFIVYFFRGFTEEYLKIQGSPAQDGEKVDWYPIKKCLQNYTINPILYNLKWLIPMALDSEIKIGSIAYHSHTS